MQLFQAPLKPPKYKKARTQTSSETTKGPLRRFLSILGPGLVTGAADDDPSGIVTYSIAGAQLGTSMLWTALLTFPLMATVQMMCARIGMVTGTGLAAAMRKKIPKPVLSLVALSLFAANTINIGADLSGMADVANLLTGVYSGFYVLGFGLVIIFATIWFKYDDIAAILKWLAVSLFAYVVTAFLVHPDWSKVLGGYFSSFMAYQSRPMVNLGGDSGYDDQPVSLLLAIVAGGRGGKSARPAHGDQSSRRQSP